MKRIKMLLYSFVESSCCLVDIKELISGINPTILNGSAFPLLILDILTLRPSH